MHRVRTVIFLSALIAGVVLGGSLTALSQDPSGSKLNRLFEEVTASGTEARGTPVGSLEGEVEQALVELDELEKQVAFEAGLSSAQPTPPAAVLSVTDLEEGKAPRIEIVRESEVDEQLPQEARASLNVQAVPVQDRGEEFDFYRSQLGSIQEEIAGHDQVLSQVKLAQNEQSEVLQDLAGEVERLSEMVAGMRGQIKVDKSVDYDQAPALYGTQYGAYNRWDSEYPPEYRRAELDQLPIPYDSVYAGKRNPDMPIATVAADRAPLFVGTDPEDVVLMTLPRRVRVAIESRRGGWYQVVAPGGERAWMRGTDLVFGPGQTSSPTRIVRIRTVVTTMTP